MSTFNLRKLDNFKEVYPKVRLEECDGLVSCYHHLNNSKLFEWGGRKTAVYWLGHRYIVEDKSAAEKIDNFISELRGDCV